MKPAFDTSFARTDTERRARYGLPWTSNDYANLRKLYLEGSSLVDMCHALQRPADGVLAKLRSTGLVAYDLLDNTYHCVVLPNPRRQTLATPNTPKEPTMSKNLIESKVFVNGTDAIGMSDGEIFSLIAKTEAEITKLEAIKTPSKRLQGAIEKLKADVGKLAEYVDSRE